MDAKTPVSALPRACTCRIVQARTYPCQTRDGIHVVIEHNPSKCKHPAVKSTKGFRELTKAVVDLVRNRGTMPARLRRKDRKSCAEAILLKGSTKARCPQEHGARRTRRVRYSLPSLPSQHDMGTFRCTLVAREQTRLPHDSHTRHSVNKRF